MECKQEQPQSVSSQDKPVRMDGEEKLADFCLVCFSKVDRSKLAKERSLLSNNLNVIFLLRNLLQVPSELLIGNFKKCGNPAYWISLCEKCSQLTGQAMEHHLQILNLVNQLRSILKLITDKMRDSSIPSEILTSCQDELKDDKKKSMQEKRLHILKSTRKFVNKYDYKTHLINPFIEGDKLARQLDETEESSSEEEDSEDCEAEEEEEERVIPVIRVMVDGKWKCRHCDKLFKRKDNVRNHEDGKHPSVLGQFECPICGKRINSQRYLSDHLHKTHKSGAPGSGLEREARKEEKGKAKLEKKETKDGKRKRARAQLQDNGKWKCRHCDKEFKNRNSFRHHEQEQHPSVPGQFSCDICGVAKNSRVGLMLHRRHNHQLNSAGNSIVVKPRKRGKRRAKPADPSTCHLCGKSFTELQGLTKHLKYVHEKKYDLHCHVCGMGMWTSTCLKVHLLKRHKDDPVTLKLIEEGARLWKCGVVGCRGTYWKESGLEEHTREVHGGGKDQNARKRFTCSFCGKTFWYWHTLKVHETSHKLGKERPYSCELCGAKFKAIAYVRKHKRRFHPELCSN